MPPFVLNIFLFASKHTGLSERVLQLITGLVSEGGRWVARRLSGRLPHCAPYAPSEVHAKGTCCLNHEGGEWESPPFPRQPVQAAAAALAIFPVCQGARQTEKWGSALPRLLGKQI